MRLPTRIDRQRVRTREKHSRFQPSIEAVEPRLLMATGFVQGYALTASNAPIVGATVQLFNPATNSSVTTTTNSDGYYAFNGVAPGTYDVSETAAGYTTSVTASDIQTVVNPAIAMSGNTAIQVTVLDPSSQSIGVTWGSNYGLGTATFELPQSSYNLAAPADEVGTEIVGSLGVTFTGNLGDVTSAGTYCSDPYQTVYQYSPFTVTPSLTSITTTLSSVPSYATNLGEIGYLYNTYGTTIPTGTSVSSVTGVALQMALWSLEYDQMPATGPMTLTNPATPFSVDPSTSSAVMSAANAFLSEAYGKSEDAYFLNLNTAAENVYDANLGQDFFATDLLNFTDTVHVQATPAITTQASPTGETVGGAALTDTADLTGGASPTGTITFTLTSPTSAVVATESVTVNGDGNYTTPSSYLPTQAGTYYWLATYSGDSNNVGVSSGTTSEPVVISPASPTITTTPNTTLVSQGTATNLKDTATFSGGYDATGTITFTLYQGTTKLDTETVAVSGGGTYATPKGYNLPTTAAAGIYQWDVNYSGDGNNSVAADNNDAAEQVTVVTPCCDNLAYTWDWIQTPSGSAGYAANLSSVRQGDTVTVNFDVPAGAYDQLTLVSYVASQPYYSASSAYLQTIYQSSTGIFGPGAAALTVTVPNSYYQVDFVCGTAISQLGLTPTDFYNSQGRLQDSTNGGSTIPTSMTGSSTVTAGETASSAFWVSSQGSALIDSLPGGPSGTSLGYWLATVVPNLMGGAAGQTNAQLAAGIKGVGSSGAFAQMVATVMSAYVTDSTLAGTVAKSYGFTVTTYGTGIDDFNVGSSGTALGLSNSISYSVITLVAALNSQSTDGYVFGSATNAAITVFGTLSGDGKIN